MKKFLALIILLSFLYNQAQTSKRLDSLKNISKEQTDLILINTLNEISWEFRNSQVDSALFYAKRALYIAESIKSEKAIASAYNSIASSFDAASNLDSAEIYHQKSLRIKTKIQDSLGMADTYTNLGVVEDIKSNYDLALQNYFKALKIYESHSKDFEKVPMVLVNIGIVYKKQKEYQKVLDYYQRALDIYKENNFEIGETIVTGNIGSVLIYLEEYQKSIEYSEKAKQLYTKLGYTRYVPYMQENIGVAKDSLKQYQSARKYYLSAVSAFEKDQNLYELSSTKISLANNYALNKEFIRARKELVEALEIINTKGFTEMKVKALQNLAKVDAQTNDFKSAYDNHKKYALVKDSLFEAEKVKNIYELETKYQTEKKEREILAQRADLAEKELNINRKNTQLIGLVILAVVISLLGYLLYKQQKLKHQQLKKESELKEALVKIETQNELQEQRLRISRDLHDNIGSQLTFIISTIENLQYGFKIENEKLVDKLANISTFTKETISELRDTIWAMNKNEITFEDLQSRISNYIDKAHLSDEHIDFSFQMDEKVNLDNTFTSVQGMNVYRIIQESINNALKYARASAINITIENTKDHRLLVTIFDNGIGFNLENVELGNGINNMKKRAEDINAQLNIKSDNNQGTSVTLII